jgi:hypothetical protein
MGRTLRGSPDLLCKLGSLTRIKCDNRVNVSRSAMRLRDARSGSLAVRIGDSERCLVDVLEAGLQLARR